MRLYIILRIKLETLHKKTIHQFKILYFFKRAWVFNYKQKARNLVVLCTINKIGICAKSNKLGMHEKWVFRLLRNNRNN